MRNFTTELKKEYSFLQGGKLDCWLMDKPMDYGAENWKRPALIVVPGGGYGMVSKREAEPIASAFFARGFQVFILWYLTVADGVCYPEQLLELSAAVDYVKKNADEFCVNKDEIFAVGFSAGGHLAGNLAIEYDTVSEKAGVALDSKPTAVGLSYPVISSKRGHFGSYVNLLNGYTEEAKEELCKTLNLDEAVTEKTPPAFIWTTACDSVVPADNALRYAMALNEKGIPYELHVYPHGEHGGSTGDGEINVNPAPFKRATRWIDDCASFFRDFVKEPF